MIAKSLFTSNGLCYESAFADIDEGRYLKDDLRIYPLKPIC
jgi:hypothetical protein